MVPLSWLKEPNRLTGECEMKNEKIKVITSKAIERPIAALNEGPSETLTAYLAPIRHFIDLFSTWSPITHKSFAEAR